MVRDHCALRKNLFSTIITFIAPLSFHHTKNISFFEIDCAVFVGGGGGRGDADSL
jgi:hypothetical protein